MKKAWIMLLTVAVIFAFTACAAPAAKIADPSTAPTVQPSATAAPEVVVFNDPVLEKMVRKAMSKPEGDITIADAEAVKKLNLDIEYQQEIPEDTQIKDISALKYFKNLDELNMQFHAITDISPLAGLVELRGLGLGGNNISDITPLSGLKELRFLSIFSCKATDYSPLKNLTYLNTLFISYSTFSDLSVLADMQDLSALYIDSTQVSDVSLLEKLTKLKRLKLKDSKVTDYSPLKDIYPSLEEKDFELK
jgi:hypothetical protein